MSETISPKVADSLKRVVRAVNDVATAKGLTKRERLELFDHLEEYAREARAELAGS